VSDHHLFLPAAEVAVAQEAQALPTTVRMEPTVVALAVTLLVLVAWVTLLVLLEA
jgi:hypothetical protein